MKALRGIVTACGLVLGVYLIGRAVAEPFVIDFHDPRTYAQDWGGPSLPGVLAVHCGFGVLSAVLIAWWWTRRRRRTRTADTR